MNGSLRIEAQERTRQGVSRVRAAWFPVVQAAAAGAAAYSIAYYLLGHSYPFFAPVAAWVALGFSRDRELRRVAELAVGVAIGVGAGDLVVHVIGSGWWQLAVVLIASALIARFLDRGLMLTTQAGVQAIVIVGLPTASGGPVGRWVDALLGGAMALLVTVMTPTDVRARPRELARSALHDLGRVLHELARGLAGGSPERVADCLVRARASQPALDEWLDATRSAHDLARVSPAARRHREELTRLVDRAVLTDRAVRNCRVLARRAGSVVAEGAH
ncbi:MAG: FUSC family protein, partial [Actinobacteria bacterium]|nr:FUSC family protein [Actinomycetota bacterium]